MKTQVNKVEAGKRHKYPIDFDPFSNNAVEERKEVTAIRSFYYNSDILKLVQNGVRRSTHAQNLYFERILCCWTRFPANTFAFKQNLNKGVIMYKGQCNTDLGNHR